MQQQQESPERTYHSARSDKYTGMHRIPRAKTIAAPPALVMDEPLFLFTSVLVRKNHDGTIAPEEGKEEIPVSATMRTTGLCYSELTKESFLSVFQLPNLRRNSQEMERKTSS